MVFTYFTFFILFVTSGAASYNRRVPCDAVPTNGTVSTPAGDEHRRVYTCISDQYELVGRDTATCNPLTNTLDIPRLPICVFKLPRTTHITHKQSTSGPCTDETLLEEEDRLLHHIARLLCSGECTFREFRSDCIGRTLAEIESVFEVANEEVRDEVVRHMSKRHTRSKRSVFDGITPSDDETQDCEDGQGLTSDGDGCVICQAGFYSSSATNSTCEECAIGTYQNETQQATCNNCTSSETTLSTASDSEDDCVVACPIPSTSTNAAFTVDNVAVDDGSYVSAGTKVTLSCDSGYTYQSQSSYTETCSGSSTVLKSSCYDVTISTSEANSTAYLDAGGSTSFTCSVATTTSPDSFSGKIVSTGPTASASASNSLSYMAGVATQEFEYTSTGSGYSNVYCQVTVFSGDTADESTESVLVKLFSGEVSNETASTGDSVTITAKITYITDTVVSFYWTGPDGSLITKNLDETEDSSYFYSKLSISSASASSSGDYSVRMAVYGVLDLEPSVRLNVTETGTLSVEGFTINPSTSDGSSSITVGEGTEFTLTCAYLYTGSAPTIYWSTSNTGTDNVDGTSGLTVNTATTANNIVTRTMTVTSSATDSLNGGYYCKTIESGSFVSASSAFTLTISAKSVTVTSEKCSQSGDDVELTCTASYPTSLTTAPTITWYLTNTSNALSDGDDYVSSAAKSGTSYISTLLIKDTTSEDASDDYFCVAAYVEDSSYYEVTSGMGELLVIGFTAMDAQYALVGTSDISFNTTFSGTSPTIKEWKYNGNSISSPYSDDATISGSGDDYVFSITLPTLATDSIEEFQAWVMLSSPCKTDVSTTLEATAHIYILSLNMTTSATSISGSTYYAWAGDSVTVTCKYTNPATMSSDPTVSWNATDTSSSSISISPDTSASALSPTGTETVEIGTASSIHSGTYACSAAYPDSIGTASEDLTLKVLGVEPTEAEYVVEGMSTNLTCVFYGLGGTVSWTKDGGSVSGNTESVSGTTTTSVLPVDTATTADDGEYSCVMTFTGVTDTKSSQIRLNVLTVTVTISEGTVDEGDSTTLSCVVPYIDNLPLSTNLTWTRNVSGTLTTLSWTDYSKTISSAGVADAGEYYCVVAFEGEGSSAGDPVKLYVRSGPSITAVAEDSDSLVGTTTLYGTTLELSCVVYGDAINDSLTAWFVNATAWNSTDELTIETTDIGEFSAVSVLSVASAAPDTTYTCFMTYEVDSDEVSTSAEYTVVGITKVRSTSVTVDENDNVTLTCDYLTDSSLSISSVVWYFNGTEDSDAVDVTTDTVSTVTSIEVPVEYNGNVTCEVSYDNGLVSTNSDTVLYVRSLIWDLGAYLDLATGTELTITCSVYGDAMSSGYPAWKLNDTALTSATENITITDTEVSTGHLESVMVLSYVPNEWNAGTLYCEAEYADGSESASLDVIIQVVGVTVSGETQLEVGDTLNLTCSISNLDGDVTWLIDGVEQSGSGDNLSIEDVLISDTGTYTCQFTLADQEHVGVFQNSVDVVVNGFITVAMTGMQGDNVDVGETVTISITASIGDTSNTPNVTKGTSDLMTLTNTPSWTQVTGYQYSTTLEFTAEASTSADNTDTYTIAYSFSDIYLSDVLDITILETCTLPNRSSEIPELEGQTIDSGDTLSLTCSSGTISGGTSLNCSDGVVTYSPVNTAPRCVAFSVQPESVAIEYGETATLSCSSSTVSVTIAAIRWYNGDGTLVKDDTTMTTTGSTIYSSTYALSGSLDNQNTNYHCKIVMDNGVTYDSEVAYVYVTGFISVSASYPGTYFESDAQGGEFSEDATITIKYGVGPSAPSLEVNYTRTSDGDVSVVTMTQSSSSNSSVKVYTFDVLEGLKYTGTYDFKISYSGSSEVDDSTYTDSLTLPVYEFCKTSSLPSVTNGNWSPSLKTNFLEYATLSCNTNYYTVGDSTARCLADATFDLDSTPSCAASSDFSCGTLTATSNGDIVYENSSAAYYECDADYFLVNAESMYTCDSSTGIWSIVTTENPTGEAPTCEAAEDASSRTATVTMPLGDIDNYCATHESSIGTALQENLEDNSLLTCTTSLMCTFGSFSCSRSGTASTGTFTLTQTSNMDDPTTLTDDTDNMKASSASISFSVSVSKKRSTVVVTTGAATVTTNTTCATSHVTTDDYCYTCPAGYEANSDSTICIPCALGFYSPSDGSSCTACSGSLTTMNTGSDSSGDCLDPSLVCTVDTASASSTYSPPSGSRVPPTTSISIICDSGYDVEFGVSSTVPCDTPSYPECYMECSLSKYTDAVLADLNIHDNIEVLSLKHNEPITVTCMSGFEVAEDTPAKTYTCTNGFLPDFDACSEEDSAVLTTVIICVIVLGIAVILLFLFIVVQWKKKKDASYKVSGPRKMFVGPIENPVALEEGGVKMTKVSLKLQESEKKAPLMSRPVHISDFSKYYDLLTRNDDKELKAEFSTFDSFDDNNTCYNGSIPENDLKNRYKNIIPFDHSRVKLTMRRNDPYSDYINASFIHGYHKPRAFIATQAPMFETVDEYWRMIWEQKSTMITNLTKVEENGKVKSIVYWPGEGERNKQYGDVVVSRISEQETDNFTVYTFEIRNNTEDGLREVFMFNYTSWPDFDVPKRTMEFVSFIYNVRHVDSIRPKMGPMICHCSAGTGRTGAFVGIWNSLDRLCNKDDLDILGMVGALRQQRRKMVFTVSQYKFLHKVMLDILNSENYEELKRGKFRKPLEIREVTENPYVSTTDESDDDHFNDTNV